MALTSDESRLKFYKKDKRSDYHLYWNDKKSHDSTSTLNSCI